uniref:Uncharacterized protein n=1 Tax=Caenorhabditis japonica TaxID=281687 RepID=A0A8R1DF81_CAEJA
MPFWPEVSIFSRDASEWSQLLYDDREMCSKPAPTGYSVGLTAAHLIAAPIYAVAFYTLYAERSANFKVYKRYLAAHAISNLIFELHLSVMMKPVLYLPYPAIRFAGLSVLRYVNGGITFFVFLLIIVATCWSIVELFDYRFRLISGSNLSSDWVKKFAKLAKILKRVLVVLATLTVCCLALAAAGIFDQAEHKMKLEIISTFPELLCRSALVLPKAADTGIKPIHLFNISAFFAVTVGTFLSFSQGIVSLMSLREMVIQTRTSMRTIAMHKAFLISLFCQISVHGVMMGFPVIIYGVSVIFNFDGNAIGYVAIVVASMHGAMSTLAMIIFNRPLYEKASSTIFTVFSSNNVIIRDISFISMNNSR